MPRAKRAARPKSPPTGRHAQAVSLVALARGSEEFRAWCRAQGLEPTRKRVRRLLRLFAQEARKPRPLLPRITK